MCDPWVIFGAAWSRRRRKRLSQYLRNEWKHCSSKSAKQKFPRVDWRTLTESFLTPKEFSRFYKLDKENFPQKLEESVEAHRSAHGEGLAALRTRSGGTV